MPFLILVLYGLIVLSQGLRAVWCVGQLAFSLGDMTAQLDTATVDQITDEFSAAPLLMAPLSAATVKMRIMSVTPMMSGGAHPSVIGAQVAWCQTTDSATLACPGSGNSLPALPSGVTFPLGMLTSATSSVIVSQASYTYHPNVPSFLSPTAGYAIDRVNFFTPRLSPTVDCPSC